MLKPFKLIYAKDLKDEKIHNFWQAPNSHHIYRGFFINEEHARKNIDSYLNHSQIILKEHKTEKIYIQLRFADCETLTFTYPDIECNLEDFKMNIVSFKQGVIHGEIPHKLEKYQYITYGKLK